MTRGLPSLVHHVAGAADAPWVTFIPGIGNDARFWDTQARALADRFHVLTFDPWGHGDSPQPPKDCSFDVIVAGVLQLFDELGIPRSHVVGLGFGGSVALALGLAAPARVDRIVACCCRPRQPDDRRDFWRGRMATAREQGLAPLADQTVDRWFAPPFRAAHPDIDAELRLAMKRTSVEGYLGYVGAFTEMDFEERLPALTARTLLVAAEHDHGGGPVETMRAMARRLPNAQLTVLPGCGHIVNHEQPSAVSSLLREFLAAE